jgi:hypothetical protein
METSPLLRSCCQALSGLAVLAGGLGVIALGAAYLNESQMERLASRATAVAAAAIVFGAGLISLTILAVRKV